MLCFTSLRNNTAADKLCFKTKYVTISGISKPYISEFLLKKISDPRTNYVLCYTQCSQMFRTVT